MVIGEVTGKSQLTGNDFCQLYRDVQGHEVGLGMELGTNSYCLWVGFCPSLFLHINNPITKTPDDYVLIEY